MTVVLALAVLLSGPEQASGTPTGVPDSMAALGDSITRAMDADGDPLHLGDQLPYSWSTGDSSAVQSHYYRIRRQYNPITDNYYNRAVSGAKMTNLNGQALLALSDDAGVEYVTILMGANDVCTYSEAEMTPVETYRSQFQQAMDTLTQGTAGQARRIFVASIPDIYQLWAVLHDNPSAVTVWNTYYVCHSLLVNPTSEAQADVDRRARVRQRNIDFNTVLSEVCALYAQCRFDNNVVFDGGVEASQVSTLDYFHPSITGQANIASVTWDATYDFPLPIGGVAELPEAADSSHSGYVVVAVLAGAALAALGAGGWFARRRRLG